MQQNIKADSISPRDILSFLNPRRIFFGWWLTIAGGLLCFWGYAFQAYGFSAMFKPISDELGFSRTSTSFAASLTRFEGGLEAPVVGYLADRYGPRLTIMFGVFLMGLGLILMNWIHSLISFYIVWSVICATGSNISLSMPLDVAITNWFIKQRGKAISLKWVFSGLSGMIGLPMVAYLIAGYGWRITCVIGGVVMIVVGLPIVWIFIKPHRPEHYGLLPDGASPDEKKKIDTNSHPQMEEAVEYEFTAKEAMRTPAFWLLIIAYTFHGALYPVMNIHCIPFLTDRGMDPVAAAATMSVFITASIPARFLGGVIIDRVKTSMVRFVLVGAFLCQCTGVTIFLFNQQSTIALYTFFVIYGIGMGAVMTLTPVIRSRYFGRKAFGTIAGISRAMSVPVGVIGPVAAGWIFDTTGSYIIAFTLFAIFIGIAAAIVSFIKPPKPPKIQMGIAPA